MTKLGRPNIVGNQIVAALEQKPGMKFAALSEAIGHDKPRSLSSILYRMLEDGVIFSAGTSDHQRHYFALESDAQAWDDALPESLNRSRARQRAYQRRKYAKDAASRPPRRAGWSAEHEQAIRDHYPTKGAGFVAELTGKKIELVRSRAAYLGVRNLVSTRGGVPYVKHERAPGFSIAKPAKGPGYLDIPADERRAVRVVHPTPAPRFHVPIDFKGPFSLAGVGRDVTTGRAWSA